MVPDDEDPDKDLSTEAVVKDQLEALKKSGVLTAANTIFISCWTDPKTKEWVKTEAEKYSHGNKFVFVEDFNTTIYSKVKKTFEFPTLDALWQHSTAQAADNELVFYMHSKSHRPWRHALQAFLLTRFRDCVCHLSSSNYQTCGPNLELRPEGATWPHYSGK